MMNAASIFSHHPWLQHSAAETVIMGDDLDAALSSFLYLAKNPSAKLVGIYTGYSTLFHNGSLSKSDLENSIFIDLDICHAKCRSLGHHIVRNNADDALTGLRNSCNPNEIVGRSVTQRFSEKYPLGTIHFLMWLYNEPIPETQFGEHLIWLADSAFINGQPHCYSKNVEQWIRFEMSHRPFIQSLPKIDTLQFEKEMHQLQYQLLTMGFQKGKWKNKSRHKGLAGFQCQPTDFTASGMSRYVVKIFNMISSITGWNINSQQLDIEPLKSITGRRTSDTLSDALKGTSLDSFLSTKNVFSYAIPYKDNINYTTGIL